MSSETVISVVPITSPALLAKQAAAKEQVRKRAFEIYCERQRKSHALSDWLEAEREMEVVPCAGIESSETGFRIQARMPHFDADHLTVSGLSDSIVVEGQCCDNAPPKITILRVPRPIRAETIKARMRRGMLVITAEKAGNTQVVASSTCLLPATSPASRKRLVLRTRRKDFAVPAAVSSAAAI